MCFRRFLLVYPKTDCSLSFNHQYNGKYSCIIDNSRNIDYNQTINLLGGKNMFCVNCGTELADDAKFCHVCGQQIGGTALNVQNNYVQPVKSRDDVLNDVRIAKDYIQRAESSYNEVFRLEREKNQIEYFRDVQKKANKKLIPFVSIIYNLVHKADIDALNKFLIDHNYNVKFLKSSRTLSLIFDAIFVILWIVANFAGDKLGTPYGIAFMVVFFVALFFELRYLKARRKYVKITKQAIQDISASYESTCQNAYDETCRILSEYKRVYGMIPDRYMNSYALKYIESCVCDGRADTLKEAMNLFEAYDVQQQAIKQSNEQYQQLLQQQQEMLSQYQRNEAINGIADGLILMSLALG